MCESTAYLVSSEGTLPIMENVIYAVPQKDGQVFLEDILGEQKTVHGRLKEIKLLDHKILIEAV
ncbi:MAG: CooT family nickel-binding protein [Eubacteriaceae bacterium]|jgi:predicted RNA-binding protein|nr:CooT family nickel-binding protein [Eubacteriaceae bacterium]